MSENLRNMLLTQEAAAHEEVRKWLSSLAYAQSRLELATMCQDPEPIVRAAAASMAGEAFQDIVATSVLPLLNDPVRYVRFAACEAVIFSNCNTAAASLMQLIRHDPEPRIRNIAAIALGKVGDPALVPELRNLAAIECGVDHENRSISQVILSASNEIDKRFFANK
jgi:HEAT repeat protein